jgi:hypothetical protein
MTMHLLLHGAWHGAWCWVPLQDELAACGVDSIAVDLPIEEPDAGIARYADVVCAAIDGHEDVVIVAHSLSGLVAPVVAERVEARGIVMLAALWPEPGRSAREQARALPGIYSDGYRAVEQVRYDDGGTGLTPADARDLLYQDCDPALASSAAARLRPQHWGVWAEPSPLPAWPAIPTAGVVCRQDRMLGEIGMVAGAERIGATLTWLDSGHSPMLAIPRELATVIVDTSRAWS